MNYSVLMGYGFVDNIIYGSGKKKLNTFLKYGTQRSLNKETKM